MSNDLRDLTSSQLTKQEQVNLITQQIVRGLLGQSGNGIPIRATADTNTAGGNHFSSADPTNGIGIKAWSQNGTYGIEARNTGLYLTGQSGSSFTQGSVLFMGSSGLVSQDNTNFFWDDTGNTLKSLNLIVPTKAAIGASSLGSEVLTVTGNGRISTFLGVGGAPDTTHAILVTGLSKFTSRMGVGGDPDATVISKITGDQWITSKLGIGGTVDGTFVVKVTGSSSLWTTGIAQFDTRVGIGGAADGSAAFKVTGNSIFTGNIVNDTTTFVTDATNNSVGILTASPDSKLHVAGLIHVTDLVAFPTGGAGWEIYYDTVTPLAVIQSYSRSGSAWLNNAIYGLSVIIGASGVEKFKVDTTGIGFFGTAPTAQAADFGAVATGTADATYGTAERDSINEHSTAINAIRTLLRDKGLMA